jgi:hypothetical protein
MLHLMHLASIPLIAMIVVVVVADFNLQPTIVGLSRLVQYSLVVAAITLAGSAPSVQNFFPLLLQGSYHISDYHPANLIDLNCTRLC